MSNENSLGWLWRWLRRVALHAFLGALSGALFGALSVCIAGVVIALIIGMTPGNSAGFDDEMLAVCFVAASMGSSLGGIAGGAGGFISWLIAGFTASTSLPFRALFKRTGWTLFGGAMTGIFGYVTWCLWHSLKSGKSFAYEFGDRVFEAAFGVSAWMAVAHLAAMLVLAGRTSTSKHDDAIAPYELN